ncbi:hypothetical protein [Zooshikella sp. RANM57]|uniref:hypothetical protein n=1 Tax=Zooshikella sp. RANM57 TaxID=3425863 RepID=UPI003D6ED642
MKKILLLQLLIMMTGCSLHLQHIPSWPKLDVIQLSDGGVCLSPDSARKLARYRAELESL